MAALTAAQLAELMSYGPSQALINALAAGTADTNQALPATVKATTVRCPDGRSDAQLAHSARQRTGC